MSPIKEDVQNRAVSPIKIKVQRRGVSPIKNQESRGVSPNPQIVTIDKRFQIIFSLAVELINKDFNYQKKVLESEEEMVREIEILIQSTKMMRTKSNAPTLKIKPKIDLNDFSQIDQKYENLK